MAKTGSGLTNPVLVGIRTPGTLLNTEDEWFSLKTQLIPGPGYSTTHNGIISPLYTVGPNKLWNRKTTVKLNSSIRVLRIRKTAILQLQQ